MRIAIFFAVLFIFLSTLSLKAQTTYQVNGRTLLLINGIYYDVTTTDTIKVDTKHLTIKFVAGQETSGLSNLQSQYSLSVIDDPLNGYYDFNIPLNANYVNLINGINQKAYKDKLILSYNIKPHTKPYPNDPGNSSYPMSPEHAWYLNLMNVLNAWDITTGDPLLKIALIDDGFYTSDLDIINDQSLNYNVVTGNSNVTPVGNSHGTAMSSIIGSRTNNSLGMFGISGGWNGFGGCNTFMISITQDFVTSRIDNAIFLAVLRGAKIINMSWGGIGWFDEAINEEINDAYVKGVVMFASAGNSNGSVAWPATHEHVISVGGVNELDKRWQLAQEGSCFGPETEISTVAGRLKYRIMI